MRGSKGSKRGVIIYEQKRLRLHKSLQLNPSNNKKSASHVRRKRDNFQGGVKNLSVNVIKQMSGVWSSHSAFPFDAPAQSGARRHHASGKGHHASGKGHHASGKASRKVRRAGQAEVVAKAGEMEKVAGMAVKAGQEAMKAGQEVTKVAGQMKTAGRRLKKTAKKAKKGARRYY
jgi:hypothetical protein